MLSEPQRHGEHGIKINHHKKCFSGNPSWTIWILNRACKKMMKMERRDSVNILFILPNNPTEIFTFTCLYFVVWLWAKYLTPLISSFLICKMELIIIFTSKVILELREILFVKCLIQALAKSALMVFTAYEWALSSASSQLKKKKLTIIWCDKYYRGNLR